MDNKENLKTVEGYSEPNQTFKMKLLERIVKKLHLRLLT